MRTRRYICTLLLVIGYTLALLAQEVNLTITPLRTVLPPQVMYYLSNTGQYFNVSVQNTTNETQRIYFGIEVRQVTPASSLEIIIPGKTMPRQAIELQPQQTRVLTAAEMRTLFNHVRSEDIVMPANLFSDVTSGSFGNLPEGTYEICMTAYRWDPRLTTPVVVNNPVVSKCLFNVCYEATAPQWVMPISTGEYEDRSIATLSQQAPLLQWMAPVVNCDPKPRTYTYDLKIVQQLPLQAIDQAIERNPVVYQATGLTMPQCMIPAHIISKFSSVETYVAQITTRSNATQEGALDYIHLQNDGKSDLKMFRVKDYTQASDVKVTYSAPTITTPNAEQKYQKVISFNASNPLVEWKAPVADVAGGKNVNFTYDVRIVSPDQYDPTLAENRIKSAKTVTPYWQQTGITGTSLTLPASAFEKLDDGNVYLLAVVAHPDTVAGAYRTMSFKNDGYSVVMFSTAANVISRPVFLFPTPMTVYENDEDLVAKEMFDVIDQNNATIRWKAAEGVTASGSLPEIVYDLKIAEPNFDATDTYDIDEAKTIYERKGIKGTSLQLDAEFFDNFKETGKEDLVHLMQVTARFADGADNAGNYYLAYDGKSAPALVAIVGDSARNTVYSAPQFITPKPYTELSNEYIDEIGLNNPVVSWKKPEASGNKKEPVNFTYNLKVVSFTSAYEMQLSDMQLAVEEEEPIYEANNLEETSHTLPQSFLDEISTDKIYVMRVYAVPDTASNKSTVKHIFRNYGRSVPALFRFVTHKDADEDQITDSLYNFVNPEIVLPRYLDPDAARKEFVDCDIAMEWHKPQFGGGSGETPDSVKFVYDIEMYRADTYTPRDSMFLTKPVYTVEGVTQTTDTLRWAKFKDKVSKGDYILLRVKPRALNETSVHFFNDSINTVDFALAEKYTKRYFQCANQVAIDNEEPTTKKAKDLKGKTVTVGEYDLVLDGNLKDVGDGKFSGTGHVIWEPLALTWKLAVKFDTICINTENQVYKGLVVTYGGENPMTSSQVVDQLFSDWGIDNLIGDTGIPYASQLQSAAKDKIKGLAEKYDLSKYYKEVMDGKAKVLGLLKGDVENVTFPLEIPKELNSTPVNLQISTMKFAPTYATMDLIGTFVVPETEATHNQILVFGAPRLCISPSSLIPEAGAVSLLKDFEIQDPKTGFMIKFKAPQNVTEPENDGCFMSWSNNKFEALNVDLDMTMPNDLKKVSNGKATDEAVQLHVQTTIQSWDDWHASANLDPFEHADLPGYVFTAQNVVIDYSLTQNEKTMGAFPSDYKKDEAGITNSNEATWRGLYMKELSMEFPADIKVGNGEERMKVQLNNMFIDKSGVTVDCKVVNAINYTAGEEGTIGGFAFTMDNIRASVVQNNFRDFGFDGTLKIPMFKGTIQYACNIYNQAYTRKGTKEGYAYVFKTHQIENLDFDFMLGNLSLDKKMTYFLVEATPDETGTLKTNVELCVGGEVTIAGADMVNKKLAKLPMKLTLPEIKFCNMRIANNKEFTSVYESTMQKAARDAAKATVLSMKSEWTKSNKGEDGKTGVSSEEEGKLEDTGNFYWSFGQWGYSSPQKKIGPFKFELKGWKFKLNKEDNESYVGITLDGAISFCDELKLSASTKLEFQAWVRNLDKVKGVGDISKLSLEYKEVKFHEATFGFSTVGFKLDGTLECAGDGTSDKGYTGTLKADIGEGLFKVDVMGGYYDHEEDNNNYSWGFFNIKLGGTCGIPIPPLKISDIAGGMYFNCKYNAKDEAHPTPKQGVIGIIAGMGIATADGVTFKGKMEMVCVVEKSGDSYGLTSFMFNGDVSCMSGLLTSKVSMEYESNDKDQYFQLNITAEASAAGALKGVQEKMNALETKLKALKEDVEVASESVQKSLKGMFADKQTESSDFKKNTSKYKEKQNKDNSSSSATVGKVTVSLDLRIQTKKDGKNLSSCLWHVYLGKPTESERCQFILVDFNTKIVKVGAGANAYLCIGSELPDDGELPPIPTKVRQFLDGGEHGAATSDDISKAETARTSAKAKFFANAKVDGGVMLGASVWGYVDVDLGLFYGDMGITAGFDVSVRKLSGNSKCMNIGGTPGKNGWYGEGQLYAYLYAKFGFNLNLGFFKKKIDLLDAGLGGVLRCALPNPNYFTGKARMKLKMLGGLVNINKSFEFECGNVCELYLGGALDNYKLFESCNIGCETLDDAMKSPLEWQVQKRPVVYTQGDLNSIIRVIDPTDRDRIANSSAGDGKSDNALDDMASRQFKFSMYGSQPIEIKEYYSKDSVNKNKVADTYYPEYSIDRNEVTIEYPTLKRNRIYRLTVTGKAWEFYNGSWRNTQQWDSLKNKYVEVVWTQSKDFWFVTNDNAEREIDDKDDLQNYVAVAYPSMSSDGATGKQIIYGKEYMSIDFSGHSSSGIEKYNPSAIEDIQRPTISLTQYLKNKLYCNDNNGKLTWVLLDKKTGTRQTRENLWIEEGGVSILTPKTPFDNIVKGNSYSIRLVYEWTEDYTGAWTWTKFKTEEVYGKSRSEVLKRYENMYNAQTTTSQDNSKEILAAYQESKAEGVIEKANAFNKSYTAFTKPNQSVSSSQIQKDQLLPSTKYRIDVQQVDLMNVSDGGVESNVFDDYGTYNDSYKSTTSSSSYGKVTSSNAGQLKFKVTIYKYGKETLQKKHTKYLAFMDADAYRSYTNKTDYFDDAPLYSRYFQAEVLVTAPGTTYISNDESILGEMKKDAKFPTFAYELEKPYKLAGLTITKGYMPKTMEDPFIYLSYLSNMFFVGGHRFESGEKDLNYSKMSLQSLYLTSPFGSWECTLGANYATNQLLSSVQALQDKTCISQDLLRLKTGSTYPLYTDGSKECVASLGTKSDARLTDYHRLNRETYANIFADLYYVCTIVSDYITYYVDRYRSYNKDDWKEFLQVYAGSSCAFKNYTWTKVYIPWDQFAVVWTGANQNGMNISKTIQLSDNKYRHPRINKDTGFGKRLYASALSQESYAPSDCQKNYQHELFEGALISKHNDYSMIFDCYRVNAWDIDNQQWTVYTENDIPNFQGVKIEKFLDLVSKYGLEVSPNATATETATSTQTINKNHRNATKGNTIIGAPNK